MSDKKIAVYICEGCEIGDSLDLGELSKIPENHPCTTHSCLCSAEGVELIKKDLRDGVQALVIAACSPRFKNEVFDFQDCLVERVNLRELVVWSHEPNDEDTQMMAEDYLRMGIVRAETAELPEPFQIPINKSILVVGGGLAGMTSALEAARTGYDVKLIEKESALGGWRSRFYKQFKTAHPFNGVESIDLDSEIRELESNDLIKIYTSSTVAGISGQPGQFEVKIRQNGSIETFEVGAVIQATGWKPYDAGRLPHLGYGASPDVVTNVEMEQLLCRGELKRPSDGKPIRTIGFIQCAGSRDPDHLPYCSTVCCRATMKQILCAKELDEDVTCFVIYKDIRSPGQFEDLYRRVQDTPGVMFTKGEVASVDANGQVQIEVDETLIGERIRLEVDLLVLATGMVPASADGEAIRRYRDAKAVLDNEEKVGAQREAAKATVDELEPIVGESILNLEYRQGPDVPVLKHNFPDSHFICFPYESRRTGIYMAGCTRAPGDTESVRADAAGAVLKAIQTVELAEQGKAVHPRWEDISYPDFFLQRCTGCKRCTEECPFGTLNEDEKGTPQPNLTRCRRCGICLGACPERVISFKDYSVEIVSQMIKAVEIPDEFEEKPRILALICENDAYPALDNAGFRRLKHSAFIRVIPVRCLGSVNTVWIADALSRGFDGVILIGCKSGDDYQCHFIRGSELMGVRGKNVKEKLQQLALEEERVRVEELTIVDSDRIAEVISEFCEEIEEIGLNPFKGF